MKNSKMITKVLSIIIISVTIMFSLSNIAFASLNTSSFKPPALTDKDTSAAFQMGNTIIEVVRIVGVIVAIIGLIAIGIKFMAGSVEQRAEYKKTMIPYLIGCIMIFVITTIIGVIGDLVVQIEA